MSRISDSLVAFNAGELSPLLAFRSDLDAYKRGCQTAKNVYITPQGPLIRRNGSVFTEDTKNGITRETRAIDFVFSEIDSYVLEFGHLYLRFFQDQAQVLNLGVPYEVVSPYTEDQIFDVKYVQQGDIMYLSHPEHRPYKLSRLGATNWTLAAVDNLYGPVIDRDEGEATTMQVAGTLSVGGSITVTASDANFGTNGIGFEAGHVGSVWGFGESSNSLSPYGDWTAGAVVGANEYRKYAGNLYFTSAGGTAGTIPPTHEFGTVSDGGISWLFVNRGIGYARMTSRTSATVAVFTVQMRIPPTIETGSPQFAATTFWYEAAWSGVRGYPRGISFHESRLAFAGTDQDPITYDMSRPNNRYENFDPSGGDADGAIRNTFDGAINTVQWLVSQGDFLVAGTFGGLAYATSGTNREPITPTNISAKNSSSYGANSVQGIVVNDGIIYVERNGKKLLRASYDDIILNFAVQDISVGAEHILKGKVKQLAFQTEPFAIVWGVLENGKAFTLTQETTQQVNGYSVQITGERSDGTFDFIESIAVIPGELNDEVWFISKRNIDGGLERYMEYFEPDDSLMYFVDCGIQYSGVPITTVTGLTHLIAEDASILADGTVAGTAVAVSVTGTLTLPQQASVVYAGRPFNSDVEPMPPEGGGDNGPSIGKKKKISDLKLGLYKTLGLKYGKDFSNLYDVGFAEAGQVDANNMPLLFGDPKPQIKKLDFDNDWEEVKNISIRQSLPLPMTLCSISYTMETNDS